MFGKIQLENFMGLTSMPQKAISAWDKVKELDGAQYKPIIYCGKQIVKGVNHWCIAEQTFAVAGTEERRLVKLAVNEFNGEFEPVKDSIEVVIG